MSRLTKYQGKRKKQFVWVSSVLIAVAGAAAILLAYTSLHANSASPKEPDKIISASSSAAPSSTAPEASSGAEGNASSPPPPSSSPPATPAPTAASSPRIEYRGPVEHIFFHPLLVRPELAFDGDTMSKGFDDWFVTVDEFDGILKQLEQNGYILVRMTDLYQEETEADGTKQMKLRTLLLPEGKKPLVLSVDDLNYYSYMIENGTNKKLVLDDQGRIAAEYADKAGKDVVSRTTELVPILDSFVEEHPDFSLDGAKGILALTGYEGVMGYRTNDPTRGDYEEEKAGAKKIADTLKAKGWTFASHGWGHPDVPKASVDRMTKDTARWKKEVEPLIGATNIFIYPYGDRVKHDDPRFRLLTESGFRVFCGVGPNPYLRAEGDLLEMDRRHIDGIGLKTQANRLSGLFDASTVLDARRPHTP